MKTITPNRMMIAIFAVLLSIFVVSCQKESSLTEPTTLTEEEAATYSEESTQAEASFDDAEDIGFTAAEEEGNAGGFGLEGRSASVQGRIYLPGFG